MSTLYKSTRSNWTTGVAWGHETRWGHGVTHTVSAPGEPQLCEYGVIHAYRTPEQAAFMAPQYGYEGGVLWAAEGEVVVEDPTKVGCRSLTTWHTADLPVLPAAVRVRVAIAVGRMTGPPPEWVRWADAWDSGEDRTANAAHAAAVAADTFAANTAYAAAHAVAVAVEVAVAVAVAVTAAATAYTFDLTHLIHQAIEAEAALAGGQS